MHPKHKIPPKKIAEWQSEVEYVSTEKPADLSWFKRIMNSISEFFSDLFKPFRNADVPFTIYDFIQWFTVILLLAIVGYVLYKRQFKLKSPISDNKLYSVDEIQPKDIEDVNFESLIKKASENKDWRLYTRLQFLLLLQNLNDAAVIKWSQEKTNQHYYLEMLSSPFKDDFQKCRKLFEEVWYGEKETNEGMMDEIKKNFSLLNQQINNR